MKAKGEGRKAKTEGKVSKRKAEAEGALVFAYGSNLRVEQMLARCPSATVVTTARLVGHGLAFVGFSRTWGGSVATVVVDPNDSVDGVLYRVTSADLAGLDAFEGAPLVYTRAMCRFAGGLRAWVYYHAPASPRGPSYRYFAAVVEGRARFGYSAAPAVDAAERAVTQSADAPF